MSLVKGLEIDLEEETPLVERREAFLLGKAVFGVFIL